MQNAIMTSDSMADNGFQQELQTVNNCDIGGLNDGPSSYGPPSPLTGCYLLIVLGEPHSHEHKDIILQRLLKGNKIHIYFTHIFLFSYCIQYDQIASSHLSLRPIKCVVTTNKILGKTKCVLFSSMKFDRFSP